MIIKDPQVAKLFADPCRRSILHNLRHREMTPYQLAKALGKNVSSIIHHLNALEKAGLVKQSRRAVKGNLIEKYYKATAKIFIISYTLSEGITPGSEDIARWTKEICRSASMSLEAFGYNIPERNRDRISKLIERYSSLRQIAYEEAISKQRRPVNISQPALRLLISLLSSIHLYHNPEFSEIMEELSEILRENEGTR